jgi:hypothetical protein
VDWSQLKPIEQFDVWVIHGMLVGQLIFVIRWVRLPWYREWIGRSLMMKSAALLALIAVSIALFWSLIITDTEWHYALHIQLATHLFVLLGIWSQVVALEREQRIAKLAQRAVGGTTRRRGVPARAAAACNPVGVGGPVDPDPQEATVATPVPNAPVDRQTPASTLAPSLIRTLVPFLAGLIGTWLVDKFGVNIDSTTLGIVVSAGIGYGYYVVARFLEVYGSTKWGYILGIKKVPVYADPPLPKVIVAEENTNSRKGELGAAPIATVGYILAVGAAVLLLIGLLSPRFDPSVVVLLLVGVLGIVLIAVDRHSTTRR